ncbi:uncharacterized protein LOC111489472 isoform X2 [Cucurbita maxima]|nr:uncharacterized protein LOC111489472 isoform X2 [Cucurbita maxima]
MTLLSGRSFSLNPNAPIFIPYALRNVEDFSPKWWELVTTSPWFQYYWLSQHQEDDFDSSTNDLVTTEEFLDLEEAEFEAMVQSTEADETPDIKPTAPKNLIKGAIHENGCQKIIGGSSHSKISIRLQFVLQSTVRSQLSAGAPNTLQGSFTSLVEKEMQTGCWKFNRVRRGRVLGTSRIVLSHSS